MLEATLPTSIAADKASSSCKENLVSCFPLSGLETATEMSYFFSFTKSTVTFHAASDKECSTEQYHAPIACSPEMLYGNHAQPNPYFSHILLVHRSLRGTDH